MVKMGRHKAALILLSPVRYPQEREALCSSWPNFPPVLLVSALVVQAEHGAACRVQTEHGAWCRQSMVQDAGRAWCRVQDAGRAWCQVLLGAAVPPQAGSKLGGTFWMLVP